MQTLQKMERYSGHFYNWYDTQTLMPLPPHYISTVDSGNMAGHLITMKQGLLLLAGKPVVGVNFYDSLLTTLEIVQEKMGNQNGTGKLEEYGVRQKVWSCEFIIIRQTGRI
jgi:hypothetical protein